LHIVEVIGHPDEQSMIDAIIKKIEVSQSSLTSRPADDVLAAVSFTRISNDLSQNLNVVYKLRFPNTLRVRGGVYKNWATGRTYPDRFVLGPRVGKMFTSGSPGL